MQFILFTILLTSKNFFFYEIGMFKKINWNLNANMKKIFLLP